MRIKSKILSLTLISVLLTQACNTSLLNRVILAVDAAPILINSFQLPTDEAARLTQGFGALSLALKAVRDHHDAGTVQILINVFDDLLSRNVFHVSNPTAQARITAIVGVLRLLVSTFTGSGAERTEGGKVDSKVKELEGLMKP